MARPSKFRSEEKLRIVLSVLRGEASIAETARRERVSETSVAKWRDLFLEGGAQALADGAQRGPSRREVELQRRLEEVTSALGEAQLRLAGGQPGEQRVEVGAREGPVERLGDLAVVIFECRDPGRERVEIGEVVGGQGLALQDREEDLDLVQPRRMDRQMDQARVGPGVRESRD